MNAALRRAAFALAAVLAAGAMREAHARTLQAQVQRVIDGDSIVVRSEPEGQVLTLRLRGIDAPERCQEGGPGARAALTQRVLGRTVLVRTHGQDPYRRTLATLTLDGQDLNGWMVTQGHAWNGGSRQDPGRYADEQRSAMSLRRGVHADPHPLRPHEFRRIHGNCPPIAKPR